MKGIHPDFDEFAAALVRNKVEFVVVGAYALGRLGHPRATVDIDFWIRPDKENLGALVRALSDFGVGSLGLREEDFGPGRVVQIGVEPVRIDLMTEVDGLTADEVWASRETARLGSQDVPFIGREAYIKNKLAAGRPKDIGDLHALGVRPPKGGGKG